MDSNITINDLNQTQIQYIVDDLLIRANDARLSDKAFTEYVFKEETTRKPIKVAPHQEIIFEFIDYHERCVIAMPPGHAKTFTSAAIATRMLGKNRTDRGAIISATQGQAEKPLSMIRGYIESSPELRLVYPDLVRSTRQGEPWTQTKITVNRPVGIRDPSIVAIGYRGAIDGARLKWVIADDLLNEENTSTIDQRDAVHSWFDTSVLSRLDPYGSKIIFNNTSWHIDDLQHRLEKLGWPVLRMGLSGYIEIKNTNFDSPGLRPSSPGSYECRLVRNDPDPDNIKTLWPDRINTEKQLDLKRRHLPHTYDRLFEQKCRNNEEAMCKEEWIEEAKTKGVGLEFVSRYDGPDPTFTGVDLAISEKEKSADTSFFTFKVTPTGHRVILNIEAGKWDGKTIIRKLINTHKNYNSILRVENNAAQDFIRQWALVEDVTLPIQPHTTGKQKADPTHGVASLFIELANGAWVIPCDRLRQVHPVVQRWIDACLYYNPAKHTDDVLMACYFARESAKKYGIISGSGTASMPINVNIMQR